MKGYYGECKMGNYVLEVTVVYQSYEKVAILYDHFMAVVGY